MTNNQNNRNVFTKSLGAVGRLKNKWQNYPTGSPANEYRQGTLNEQLTYWNGQKVHIENHQHKLLMNIAKLMAEYEFEMYSKISKPKKQNNPFHKINSYFNKSSANAALGALIFKNYFAQTLMTKSQLTWHLGISRNALSEKVDTCVKNNYLVKFNTKYGASSHLVDAYLDYANQSADGMKALANSITSLINVYTAEKSAK